MEQGIDRRRRRPIRIQTIILLGCILSSYIIKAATIHKNDNNDIDNNNDIWSRLLNGDDSITNKHILQATTNYNKNDNNSNVQSNKKRILQATRPPLPVVDTPIPTFFPTLDPTAVSIPDNSGGTGTTSAPVVDTSNLNIVQIASSDEQFSTLVSALSAARLVDTLAGPGPFTVFAPTNEAFNALPAGILDTLLEPANIGQLQDILNYHVVEGTVLSTSLTNGPVTTLNGDDVTISGVGTGVIKVNDATVTTADIVASNGVIHVIDAVLIPPQTRPPLATRPPLGSVTRPPIDPPTTNAPTTDTPTLKPTEAIVITPPPTVKATTLAPITASPTINPNPYYLVVAQTDRNLPSLSNVKVVYQSYNLNNAKAYMMEEFPCGPDSNYPQRMIVEVINGEVQVEECGACNVLYPPGGNPAKQCCKPGLINGESQSLDNGYNKFWWGGEEIYTMVTAARQFVASPYALADWTPVNNDPVVPCNQVTQAPVTPAPVPLPATPPPTPPPQVINTPTTPFPTEVAPPLDTSSPTNLVSRPLESPPPIGGGGGDTGGSKDDGWMTAGMPDGTSSEDYEWVSSDHKDCVEDHTPIFGHSKSSKKSSHWGWGNSSSHEMSLQQTTEGSKDDGWNRNGHTSASWMSYDQIMMHFKSKSSKKKCKSHKSSKSKSSKSKVWGKSSKASGKSNKSSKGGWNYALERVDFIGNGGSSSRLQRGTVVMFTCLVMGIVVALGSMC